MLERDHVPDDPVDGGLVRLSRILTDTPWLLDASHVRACLDAGLSTAEVLVALHLAAFFNHLTRVADATGIEADYDSPLPRLAPERARTAPNRPDPHAWAAPMPWSSLPDLGPGDARSAWDRWRAYRLTGSASLDEACRRALAGVAAEGCCDAADRCPDVPAVLPRSVRKFAEKLTLTPWAMGPDDVEVLRGDGGDDAAIMQVIAVVAGQNADSRLRSGLVAAALALGKRVTA